MVDRIKKLIEKQNLTATQFAGEIGVQRSAVSHLLSGRNKPSLDFMLKIKNRFPDLNLDWLLMGKGKMIETAKKEEAHFENVQEELFPEETDLKAEGQLSIETGVKESEIPFNVAKSEEPPTYHTANAEADKSARKLILLYPDNTFEVFNTR